jgi:hypothetical protein
MEQPGLLGGPLFMNLREWVASEVDYGRELVDSGLEGASNGRKAFLDGAPLSPYLSDLNREALKLATLGACLGLLGVYLGERHKPVRALAYGALGGALGFAASFAWSSQPFAETVARGAFKNMAAVRDQHWLKSHPIDYA